MSKKKEFDKHIKQFMPQELKTKRRAFNTKRYNTQPNDSSPTKLFMHLSLGGILNRSPSEVIKGNDTKAIKCELLKSFRSSSNRIKSKKVQNYWDLNDLIRNSKACKMVSEGYCKRNIRMKETQKQLGSFFINSSRLTSSKENLQTNIKYMRKILHKSFPKLDLLEPQNDHMLKIRKEDYDIIWKKDR